MYVASTSWPALCGMAMSSCLNSAADKRGVLAMPAFGVVWAVTASHLAVAVLRVNMPAHISG